MAHWQEVFERELSLREENTPNFDNVVIWTFNDILAGSENGETVLTDWQVLYALPEGGESAAATGSMWKNTWRNCKVSIWPSPRAGSCKKAARRWEWNR